MFFGLGALVGGLIAALVMLSTHRPPRHPLSLSGVARRFDDNWAHYPRTSLAMITFTGREGSSWLVSMLRATQNYSTLGKICVLGYEPLDADRIGEYDEVIRRRARLDFLLEFAKMENENQRSWEAWIDRMNGILDRGKFKNLTIKDECAFDSRLYIFKLRLGMRLYDPELSPEDSIFYAKISNALRENHGRLVILKRYNVLDRSVKAEHTQFKLLHATEEEKEEIIHRKYNVSMAESDSGARIYRGYLAQNTMMSELLRVPNAVVHYENFEEDFEYEMTWLLQFLQVPIDFDVNALYDAGKFEKATAYRLCEKVGNYKEYCEYYSKTRYAGLLQDSCDAVCDAPAA